MPAGGAPAENEVADATKDAAYEAEANTFLAKLLADYNDRDVEGIQKHLEALQKAIEKDIDGEIAMLFGGSVKKHTYVNGLSDIDVLAVVNESSLGEHSPQSLLSYFEERIQARLPGTKVKAGQFAVTINYSDGTELQLLPAVRTSNGVRIASGEGAGWSDVVRPGEFAKKLSEVNTSCGGKLVPVIKLFKGLQASLPTTSQVGGYHAESLAIEAFRGYSGRQTYKEMVSHLIRSAAERVLTPLKDSTGQSLHVDDYLGVAKSADRSRVSKALGRLGDRLAAAERRGSVEDLMGLFGE